MKLIPNSVSRAAARGALKLSKASPTLLVVGGVVGLGASAVMAAVATRKLDPIIEEHQKARIAVDEVGYIKNWSSSRERQKALIRVYKTTGWELTKLYGPTLFVGTASAVAVLGGHKILVGRHIATMAAYSGLFDQFREYRGRVAQTLGEAAEIDIYNGGHGEYKEDPDHKGEYKLGPVFEDGKPVGTVQRPWYMEGVPGWTHDPANNKMKLTGVQAHMNSRLNVYGHVFLNDVYDALHLPRTREGSVLGWLADPIKMGGDGFIDFGFMTGTDPNTVAFRNGEIPDVQLNFNYDGIIWDKI